MLSMPSLDEIRQAILRDVKSLEPQADIQVDSDYYARASALASVAEGIYARQNWMIKQFFPDSANSDYLEKHAGLRGIYRKNATYASGRGARVSGNNGAVIDAGRQLVTQDRRFYEVIEPATIQNGQALLSVRSLDVGAAQNISSETPASFLSAPTGVQSDCLLVDVQGGTEAESDSALLNRLLRRIRRPPAGGNKYDYIEWAEEIDGVSSAYVYPLRRGLGTVDIAITSDNNLPSDEIVARTQRHIDEMRPVTAKEAKVIKPSVTTIDFSIQVKLANTTLPEIQTAIQHALRRYFDSLIPADDLIVSQCEAVVSDLTGVVDRRFIQPTSNRQADTQTKIEWFRLGHITVTEIR